MTNLYEKLINNPIEFAWWLFILLIEIAFFCAIVMVWCLIHDYFLKKEDSIGFNNYKPKLLLHYKTITERVFAVITSNTGILCVYALYNTYSRLHIKEGTVNGLVLLGMIIVEISVINRIDGKMVLEVTDKEIELADNNIDEAKDKKKEAEDKKKEAVANLRLISSIEVLIMLLIISYLDNGGTKDYTPLIICMIGLVLGRFIYFDTNINAVKDTLMATTKYIKYAVIATGVSVLLTLTCYCFKIWDMEHLFEITIICHLIWVGCIIKAKGLAEEMCGFVYLFGCAMYEFYQLVKDLITST